MVSRHDFEGIPIISQQAPHRSGIHSDRKCGGRGAACDQLPRRELHTHRRTVIGVAYFFANHTLWKTPIVTFAHLGHADDCSGEGQATEWRLAIAGDGWALGIENDGCPALFLGMMDNEEGIMPDNIGPISKRKATPVKLFGFTFLPKCYDRVRTLVPYFSTRAYTSTFQCASKFQNLCPRGTRKTDLATGAAKPGMKCAKADSVLVPTDPEYYIHKDPITKASMRLCGVSFITALSVSDEFAFVKNPTAKSAHLREQTTANASTCQNFAATCLRKSDNIETTGVNLCDSYSDKLDAANAKTVNFSRDSVSVPESHGVNEHVLARLSSTGASATVGSTFCDGEQFCNLNRVHEGKCTRSAGHLCNVVTSPSSCLVSTAIRDSAIQPECKHIPRTPSDGFLSRISEASTSTCAQNATRTIALSSMNNNLSSLPLLSEPVTAISCSSRTGADSEYPKAANPVSSTCFLSDIDSRTTQSVDDLVSKNSPNHRRQILRHNKKSATNPIALRPYSQTKFPLDIICSGKIEGIKKRDSFIGSCQSERCSQGDSHFADTVNTMYSTAGSYTAGKHELVSQISTDDIKKSQFMCKQRHDNGKQYPNWSGELDKQEVGDDKNYIKKVKNVNELSSLENAIYIECNDVICNTATNFQNKLPSHTLLDSKQIISDNLSNVEIETSHSPIRNNNYGISSESDSLTNISENSTFVFNLRNNSLENFLKNIGCPESSHAPSTNSTNSLKQSLSIDRCMKDNRQNIRHNLDSLGDEAIEIKCNTITTKLSQENTKCKGSNLTLTSDDEDDDLLTRDNDIYYTAKLLLSVNLNRTPSTRSPAAVDVNKHQSDYVPLSDVNHFSVKSDEIRSPHSVFIHSTETFNHSSGVVRHDGSNERATGSSRDKERDISPRNSIVLNSAALQSNSDIDVIDDRLDRSPFKERNLAGELPHGTLNGSDTEWMELIEQIMVELFNWSELSDLVSEQEDRLGHNPTKFRMHSSHDTLVIDEPASFVDTTAATTDKGNISSSNEDTTSKESFNPAEEDDMVCSLDEQLASTDQLESNSDTFIDAVCTSEPSLTDKDELVNIYNSSEFLDCVQPLSADETTNSMPLLEAEFDPNSDEFYSSNFSGTNHTRGGFPHPYSPGPELAQEPTDAGHHLAHSADLVWGFDHGPVARRADQHVDDHWPAVWKPPEYESDQSGYETDEELDNMDEEMMRLEEKLKRFEEELGMSTDESIEDSIPAEEDRIDIKKYFPIKSSYSASHIEAAKKTDNNTSVQKKDNTDESEGTRASNDLLFLSGAGFKCGAGRRCFSASLADSSTPANSSSVVEMDKDSIEDRNEPINTSNLDDACDNSTCIDKAESPTFEKEYYFDEFSLLDVFSEGHIWYEDGIALIDFDNLALIEDRLSSNVTFFIFEDELLEESPEDVELSKLCTIDELDNADYDINDKPIRNQITTSDTNQNTMDRNLMAEKDQSFEMDSSLYSGIFLQDGYLDTLPYMRSNSPKSSCIYDTVSQEQGDSIWAKRDPMPTNSSVQASSLKPIEYDRHTSLYDNEANYSIDPGGDCEWQRMPVLCSDHRGYALDRSSTVGHGIENALSGPGNCYNPTDYARGHRAEVALPSDYVDTGTHSRLGHSSAPFDCCDSNTVVVRSADFDDDNGCVLADYAEDCDAYPAMANVDDSDYPKRPERTKQRRSSKDGATADSCREGSRATGNRRHGDARHRRALPARHSYHRSK